MKKIVVPWDDKRKGAEFSIELSRWCTAQGLINRIDYNWHYIPHSQETVFYFEDRVEMYATFFALTWVGHEV